MENNFSYGVITYNSINIGDEIQSVASMRFLPSVDEYVYREQISKFIPEHKKQTKCILNGWWMWQPFCFPPSEFIDPLLISMHFFPGIRQKILTPESKQYLIDHGPVGCRDMGSYEWLTSNGIDAYFSGCLTLTLKRNYEIPRGEYILCVDVSEKIINEIKKRTSRPVYSINRELFPIYTSKQRFELAKCVLAIYHNAYCCVSPRLHVILPCLAMETPVLRIVNNSITSTGVDMRYAGFENFFNTASEEAILSQSDGYDFDHPADNPSNHIAMRDNLIQKCKTFTGFDSEKSPLHANVNTAVKLIQLNSNNYANIKRILMWANREDLKKAYDLKCAGMNHQNLNGDKIIILRENKKTPKSIVKDSGHDNSAKINSNEVKFSIFNYYRYKFINIVTFGKIKHYNKKYELLKNIKIKKNIHFL